MASFNVFTILVTLGIPQSGTSRTLLGDGGVTTVFRFFGGNRISWSSSFFRSLVVVASLVLSEKLPSPKTPVPCVSCGLFYLSPPSDLSLCI